MSVTIDTNVMVYASNKSDPLHPIARDLLEKLTSGPEIVYLFWPTLMGYLRIVTHPSILPNPLRFAEATGNVAALLDCPHIQTPGEADGFWELYLATSKTPIGGNDIPDSHLAALMRQYDVGIIYTRDRRFRQFDGIRVRDPFEFIRNPEN